MTKAEVQNVVGWEQPRMPSRTTTARGVIERWCQSSEYVGDWPYGFSIGMPPYAYFLDGILVMIQE
jgi:hypothetical protein